MVLHMWPAMVPAGRLVTGLGVPFVFGGRGSLAVR